MVEPENGGRAIRRAVRVVSLIVLGIAALVIILGLALGWQTPRDYGLGMILAGAAVWILGLISASRILAAWNKEPLADIRQRETRLSLALIFVMGLLAIALGFGLMTLGG